MRRLVRTIPTRSPPRSAPRAPAPTPAGPRGRRLAADTVQVTLRLTLAERDLLDDIADTVRATHPGLVTRTEVATGAVRYALEAPPTT